MGDYAQRTAILADAPAITVAALTSQICGAQG